MEIGEMQIEMRSVTREVIRRSIMYGLTDGGLRSSDLPTHLYEYSTCSFGTRFQPRLNPG